MRESGQVMYNLNFNFTRSFKKLTEAPRKVGQKFHATDVDSRAGICSSAVLF